MADVRPFRALRYDPELNLAATICPPFDTIAPGQQRALYERSRYNAVRIELAADTDGGRYENAARTLRDWIAEGVLRRDSTPAYYLHEHTFPYGDRSYTRRLLFARLRLQPWSEGAVLPHEQTFGAPKEDRLKLMRAAHINASPVFLIYRDADGRVRQLLSPGEQPPVPLAEFESADGQRHRLFRIDDPADIEELERAFADETLYVADGHHRYETALGYRDEVRAQASHWTGDEPENFAMVALAAADDPGLLVLPIHRVTAAGDAWPEVQARLEALFGLQPVAGGTGDLVSGLGASRDETAFGLAADGADGLLLATVNDRHAVDRLLPQDRTPEWRALDYSIANYAIMRHCLGLTDEQMTDYTSVWFTEDAAEATAAVGEGRARYAVLLNSVPVHRVLELADAGERMPQKSTFFYPKVPTGLVFNLLED